MRCTRIACRLSLLAVPGLLYETAQAAVTFENLNTQGRVARLPLFSKIGQEPRDGHTNESRTVCIGIDQVAAIIAIYAVRNQESAVFGELRMRTLSVGP